MNIEKLKENLKSMQYAFNESVEANEKEREKMNEQILKAIKDLKEFKK
tara:strand:- start:524 stop:667 length:144 start_codon:yes stop_codon:yes gene_type:complete